MPSLRALVAFCLGLALLTCPALATWSIVIVNLATGEVAVAIATCLTGFDLKPNTIVIVPGYGVAAAQSFVGPLSLRELIRARLLQGDTASQILGALSAADPSHQDRQYGIASLVGGVITFTGGNAGAWAGGVTGQVGTYVYAIQGNVLTGQPVVTAAELALQNTPGTMADKLMAAMEAANLYGGDGRCSCNASAPTACGSPPPSFTKGAHIALMVVSRPSDLDAPCNGSAGCGSGQYWLDLNIANQQANDPDPIVQLRNRYTTWTAQQVGRPDHYQSTVTMSRSTLRADGQDTITGTVVLRDASGAPLGNSRPVTVSLRSGSTATGITFGPAVPQANGSYTFTMTGAFDAGTAIVDVATTDQFGRVGVWPQPMVMVTDVFGPCGASAVGNGTGGTLDVLRVQNSVGVDRVLEIGYGQPFTISLAAQPGSPALPAGMFALWSHLGVPPAGTELPLGGSNGALCFTPAPFAPSPTTLLADSFGAGGLVFAPQLPWSLNVPGVPALLDVALQGAVLTAPTLQFSATNAVLLRFRPLAAPTIANVTPPSPTPGQNVTVTGTNFFAWNLLQVAGSAVTINTQTATQMTFTMPNGVPCDAQLRVTNLGGLSAQRTINPTPFASSVPYSSGTRNGGALYLISGSGLGGCTVTFNGVPMTITTNTQSVIYGTTPPGAPGPATVLVRNANGCQLTLNYTYL